MKRTVIILMTVLMLFSFFQGVLKENAVKADETYQWVSLDNRFFYGRGVSSFVINPKNTNVIYVGTEHGYGMYKSTNGGSSWSEINNGLPMSDRYSLAIDPTNTQTIYAMTEDDGLFKSIDGGANWNQLIELIGKHTNSFIIDPINTQILYVGTEGCAFQVASVFKSIDGGKTWSQSGLVNRCCDSFAIDPKNNQIVYAGTEDKGIFKSTNGGIDWIQINNGLGKTIIDVRSLAIDPVNTQVIYAGIYGVFKSIDGGLNWKQISSGYLSDSIVYSLAIDPTNTNVIYAGGSRGVYKSMDGGKNWSEMNDGLINNEAHFLIIDPTNTQVIYEGTGGGIFKYAKIYSIFVTSNEGGTISSSGSNSVTLGDSKTFIITPDTGYKIKDVKVDGVSVGAVATYTFSNVNVDHTIEATFEKGSTKTVIILYIGNKNFTVNDETRTLDSPPVIKNSRTLLPIRAIIEALGGTVGWDATERKVTVTLGITTIKLWIGKSTAKVNGIDTPIDTTNPKVVPEIINSRTMLPLRFVTEKLGCDVQWDGTTKTITITYKEG